MARGKKSEKGQVSFLDNYGTTAPAVPAIREATRLWRETKYKGATDVTIKLLNYWFETDHRLADNTPFRYHTAQREAIESIIYCYEIAKARNLYDLYEQFIPSDARIRLPTPDTDVFARYATKMATGSGKTKVAALAIAWQYFNAVEGYEGYAKTFLFLAPNIIVFERLASDFAGGAIFRKDPIIPKSFRSLWDMEFYMRGDAERASSIGALYLTNIQQLYDPKEPKDAKSEPAIMTTLLGRKPPNNLNQLPNFRERIQSRSDEAIMVINDEAHHTHDDDLIWNTTIKNIHASHKKGIVVQLDFSATPRYDSGNLFAWVISDYTLKQAIIDRVVKRPIKGIMGIGEVPSDDPAIKYEPFLVAGINRWREYKTQLALLGKKPLLFIMMSNVKEADSIGSYLQHKYPDEFGGDKTLVIHTKSNGEITDKDLDRAREASKSVDNENSPINAIVSVLMLREGWDVQNVTVIIGLRPFTAKANILPEQTIGRGLRLMFRGVNQSAYQERVDIIGNEAFIQFVEDLEKFENIEFDRWDVGKDKLTINTIFPDIEQKIDLDIALPILSPILNRETALSRIIDELDIDMLECERPLPIKEGTLESRTFTYEGRDIITLESLFKREYTIPTPNNSQEIVSYYSQIIAQDLKLVSQFAVLAPKVRDFLKYKAFGKEVNLDEPDILKALSRTFALYVVKEVFLKYFRPRLIHEQIPRLENAGRKISEIRPFAWSNRIIQSTKTILNNVPCDNDFEVEFARFLDHAYDVVRFSKLPMQLGFCIPYTDTASNLRNYYPDFVVVDNDGIHYIVETKGREDIDVASKDRSATFWAERASELTNTKWEYIKILQTEYKKAQPNDFNDCVHMGRMTVNMFGDYD